MALNQRERTIAIAAGSVIGLGVLYSLLISPLEDRLSIADAHIAQDGDAVAHVSGTMSNRNRAAEIWKRVAGPTLKADETTASGQLLNYVRDSAQNVGLTLDSLKPERSEKEKDFQRIMFRATANGTMAQVKRFLDALRTATIPLRVNDVSLASRKDGLDDIALQVGISTIYELPATPATPSAAAPVAKEATP